MLSNMESGRNEVNVDEANAALDAVASAKRSVGAATAAPLWRHAAFGLLMALTMLAAAIGDEHRMLPLMGSMALTVILVLWDRKQMGMFVNGYRYGRTLPLTIALLLVMIGLAFAAIRLETNGQQTPALLTVPVAFVVGLGASLWWERIFLAEMGVGR